MLKMPTKYNDIIKRIDAAVSKFNKNIPAAQRSMFDAIMEEVAKLDTANGNIKATVANIKRIAAIKAKLNRLILTDEYKAEVKDFTKAFNDVTRLHNEYWRGVERTFKPRPLLKAVRRLAIQTTVEALTESGLDANVGEPIAKILKDNITTGGSIKDLTGALRESLLNTETPGTLERYSKTITQTSINTYSAEVTNIISSDLGLTWFLYSNSTLTTSREFCLAMRRPENRYFHISMVPSLLRAEGLFFSDPESGEERPVRINPKTDLPFGFLPNTNVANFLIVRAGYNCGHQCRPISEGLVPKDRLAEVQSRPDYQKWIKANARKAA